MEIRDRASGWKHAKLSGHENEFLVKENLDNDFDFSKSFLERINASRNNIIETSIGGLHETNVESVAGTRKTKSKTDLKVTLDNNEIVNISIKKSLGGQVYFVRAGMFMDVFENQFGIAIPPIVERAINLFWKAADDAVEIIEEYGNKNDVKAYDLQIRHQSLNATTLKAYDEDLYFALIDWFKDNAYELAKLSFSMGAAKNPNEWSDFVWYINLIGENDVDDIIPIEEICLACKANADIETYYGETNGGTTIQLPFGFVQWHQGQLQFHHNYDKIISLLS